MKIDCDTVFSSIGRFEAFPDNMTADEILAQAQAAAQDARDALSMKPRKTKVSTWSFLFVVSFPRTFSLEGLACMTKLELSKFNVL